MIAKAERIARELRLLIKNRRKTSAATIEQALCPIVTFALSRLQNLAPDKKILTTSALRGLGDHLSNRLMFVLGPTLRIDQIAIRAVSRSSKRKNAKARIKLTQAFKRFPGLLETSAYILTAWLDAQNELLVRLKRDTAPLRKHVARSRHALRPIKIRPGLSDPHDEGRSVTLIEFSGNHRVIYKPRSCDSEEVWYSALRWLNQTDVGPRFRIPFRLARKNYCWMEYLRATACRSSSAVRLFYFRWGAQTALAQILRASDLHWENWIAAGPQPVLVDAELLGSEYTRSRKKTLQDRQSLFPLLETGLLPLTTGDRAGRYRGIAPFDSMLSGRGPVNCWPRYGSLQKPPAKYINDLIRGFEAAAQIFAKRQLAREFFREIIGLLSRPANARVLFRASSEYARLLRASLEPSQMISKSDRWEWLARNCCESARSRQIALAEAQALLRCDIPRFTARRRSSHFTWKNFLAAVAQLKSAPEILRDRVLL